MHQKGHDKHEVDGAADVSEDGVEGVVGLVKVVEDEEHVEVLDHVNLYDEPVDEEADELEQDKKFQRRFSLLGEEGYHALSRSSHC